MTEHRTMNTIIHAAFRRDLRRFDDALGAFPAGSHPRAEQLARAWENCSFQLQHHHRDEETIFWPVLRELGADESLVGDLDGEHQRMLTVLEVADTKMHSFHAEPSADNASAARAAIGELRTVLESHLEHEERDLEPFAADRLKTSQMKGAQRQVRKAFKGHAGTFAAWLQDGADADARAALRHEIPPPVLFVMTKVGGRKYTRDVASVWAS